MSLLSCHWQVRASFTLTNEVGTWYLKRAEKYRLYWQGSASELTTNRAHVTKLLRINLNKEWYPGI